MPLHFSPEDEDTNPSMRLRAVESIPPKSLEEMMGEVMAEAAKSCALTRALAVEVGTLSRELTQHMREAKDDGAKIGEVAKKAATQGSNRLALLLTTLATLYELAAPALHEIAKWVHQ